MDPLETLADVLPSWARFAPALGLAVAAFLAALAAGGLGAVLVLGPVRRARHAHWTERARAVFVARRAALAGLLVLPVLAAVGAVLFSGPLSKVRAPMLDVVAAAAAFAGALVVRAVVERVALGASDGPRETWRGRVALLLARYPHVVVVALAAFAMPRAWSLGGALLLAVTVVLLAWTAFGGGIDVALAFGLARDPGPRVRAVVRTAALRMDVPAPGALELATRHANALALPLRRKLAITDGALSALADDELVSVVAHQIAHLGEPRRVSFLRAAGVLALAPLALLWPVTATAGGAGTLVLLVSVAVAELAVLAVSRGLARSADRVAHLHEGPAGVYARALERVYEANLTPAVRSDVASSHPALWDRMVAAGAAPAYARPLAPSRARLTLGVVAPAALVVVLLSGWRVGLGAWASVAPTEGALVTAMALTGGTAGDFDHLGALRESRGDLDGAVRLHQAASDLDAFAVRFPSNLAVALAKRGQCVDAEKAVHEAERRLRRSRIPARDRAHIAEAREWTEHCRAASGAVALAQTTRTR